jgi:hypothetical protein
MADSNGSSSRTTTDHDEIRAWAEARGGRPAVVADTEDSSGGGVLRIEFDAGEDRLAESDWDTFFRTFEDRELAFLYQDETADGETSRFNKFVRR